MTTTDFVIPGYVAGTWTIDRAHSHIGFVVKHMMVSKVRGHFTQFSGSIMTAADPRDSTATLSIDAASVDTSNGARDEHVRGNDFLGVSGHPTIDFASTGVRMEGATIYVVGNLTIRGITKEVIIEMEPPEFAQTAKGGTKAGFSASAQINRSDFGVDYNGPIPGGGVALSERVQIVLEIEADLGPAGRGTPAPADVS